ncbi:hypothetical protein A3C37_05225 [Candidatus Peribacteria bacterium RIFCSPHIGHO2_02_FULL_53_20]|nr:MAG: hypothetical protein A3C37_05225 [Candidatus Peribacteria bacterium RIFCSPHIGHO2_02_FULL_53_20]OGJ65921.1 MAG: hypothetical protein A3B61_05315 [Candidatus Peribacteria bacterium RIFCSPLOWO2_01_FULL_53_10]OGJ75014.1 MAG: hypothetical protein A3G69_01315 [Candidatus Peribacteria bacterium RIFCSPLOWO2_12_FULL_53_10]
MFKAYNNDQECQYFVDQDSRLQKNNPSVLLQNMHITLPFLGLKRCFFMENLQSKKTALCAVSTEAVVIDRTYISTIIGITIPLRSAELQGTRG